MEDGATGAQGTGGGICSPVMLGPEYVVPGVVRVVLERFFCKIE